MFSGPRHGRSSLGLGMKWAGVFRPFGPTIAPQNHASRFLGRGVGF